jgi:hypothetical protein
MGSPADTPDLDASELAEISALADGTLDPAERKRVQVRVERSPQLRAIYERERQVIALLTRARETDRAPASLRARIEAARPSRARRARRRFAFAGSVAVGLAVLVTALVLILPAGTPAAPSVSQAAGLAALGPAAPKPAPNPTDPGSELNLDVGEVYFPNWAQNLGWDPIGSRTDTINGRTAVTVYYEWKGKQVAYTIVEAPALKAPDVEPVVVAGTEFRTLEVGGRVIITWERNNHTCVLSTADDVSQSKLRQLAAT